MGLLKKKRHHYPILEMKKIGPEEVNFTSPKSHNKLGVKPCPSHPQSTACALCIPSYKHEWRTDEGRVLTEYYACASQETKFKLEHKR